MALASGSHLGPYEVIAPLGAGGMGEVYRARDTRLDRTVAIKVLPEHLSASDERRQRFEQEARAVSSLNHPNICTLHDIGSEGGVDFMVMELIEGETLADRLERGPLPLDEALRTAIAIGDALGKAHRQGIVHRDLKPGNVMLTKSGPKLLDFGLAKLQTRSHHEPDLSGVTEQKPLTQEGAILGTFHYMAPEQLEGKETDPRADVFAFGALLYEAVTARKAFTGTSQASLISAVLSSEPSSITPKSLDRIVRGCLAKDPDKRWQSIRDVVMQLESIENTIDKVESQPPESKTKERLLWASALIGVLVIAAVVRDGTTTSGAFTTRAVLPLPAGDQLMGGSSILGTVSSVAISPDGRSLAYVAESGGDSRLYLQKLDSFEPQIVPGTELATAPFFSPDGEWIGFVSRTTLRKTAASSGTVMDILVGNRTGHGSSWADDGSIIVGGFDQAARILDGEATAQGLGEKIADVVAWPQHLPGRGDVLVTLLEPDRIAVIGANSGEIRTVLEGYVGARYVASGHLIVADPDSNVLLAAPFDVDALVVSGAPVPVIDDVYISPRSGLPHFAVSANGTLVYVPGGPGGNALVWVDRQGRPAEELEIERGAYGHPRFSPDGTRIAVDNFMRGDRNVWVYDLERGARIRLSGEFAALPAWTPDGTRVSFFAQPGAPSMHWQTADGSSPVESLGVTSERGLNPISWSPDGSTLAYTEGQPGGGRTIYLMRPGEEPRRLFTTSFNERSPEFSPDGRYLAYVSDESGRSEVYVVPYPEGNQKWSVSTGGGQEPVWSRDGRELFYRKDYKMMAVPVDLGSDFHAGRPQELFDATYYTDTSGHPAYDVSVDGQRFLMIQDTEDERTQINVVFNWFDELERLVPTDN